jgi:hypothetical protein
VHPIKRISQFRASDAGMAGEFLVTSDLVASLNVAPFDAMLLR